MGTVKFRANAIATAVAPFLNTADATLIGTFYVTGSGVYMANAQSGNPRFTITPAAAEEFERKLPQIARGDYVVIEG